MSLPLMQSINNEMGSIIFSVYPSIYGGLGFNSSDCFFLALEQGIYKWMKQKTEIWKNIPCPTVGIITNVPPVPFAATLKTKITIAPLAGMDVVIPSPWPANIVVPGPLRLSTFLHQAFHPNYPLPSAVDADPMIYSAAFFEAVCMWMNSLWLIQIDDPTNPIITNAQGVGVILFPGVKVMGDLFAKVCKLYKPTNYYVYFAIFAFFLWLGVQGNLTLPIPTIGTAPAGPYVGLTCPLPFLIPEDAPSLPGMPSISGPNIALPKFSIPPLPAFTIPEYPGLPGLPDISFAVPEINLDFVLPILGLLDWKCLVEYLFDIKGFPFTLGEIKFWSIGDWNFRITLPDFGPFSLDDILVGFNLTLPEFCSLTNLFSLPSFTMPEMTLLVWPPTVLLCSDGLEGSLKIIDSNSGELHKDAYETGAMSGIYLSAIMKDMCDSGEPPSPPMTSGGFSTGFSIGFEVYIYDGYVVESEPQIEFCRSDYNIFTSASFNKQINTVRNGAFTSADSYANIISVFATGDIEGPTSGTSLSTLYNLRKPKVFAFNQDNSVPFVERF